MTSANVTEYNILRNDEHVGHFRKNVLCKLPDYADLLKYQPLKEHTIWEYWYDEEEELVEEGPENLEDFLRKMRSNKIIKEYFDNIHLMTERTNKIKKLKI